MSRPPMSFRLEQQLLIIVIRKLHQRGFTSAEIGAFIRMRHPGFRDWMVHTYSPRMELPTGRPQRVITEEYVTQMLKHES